VAAATTLYRVAIELSDLDRNVYESLDLRLAQHPSEPLDRVVIRLLAYLLVYEEGLEFGRGLSDADEAALWTHDLTGRLLHWVDVGLPSAERVHLATKRAERVTIVCHKDPDLLKKELLKRKGHRGENLKLLALDPEFVAKLASNLERTNQWSVLVQDDEIHVTSRDVTVSTTLLRPSLS
jgi:uncharacterized protein YaeQ